MPKFKMVYFPIIIFLALALVLFFGLGRDPTAMDAARVGQQVPSFNLPILAGRHRLLEDTAEKALIDRARLLQDLQAPGQPTTPWLLNVWGSWCPQCYHEHGFIQALSDAGVTVIGLNYKDDKAKAQTFLNNLGDPYALVIQDIKGDLGFDLGVYGAPETFVIGRDGVVLLRHAGVVDRRVWDEKMAPLFEQPVFQVNPEVSP